MTTPAGLDEMTERRYWDDYATQTRDRTRPTGKKMVDDRNDLLHGLSDFVRT
jgi:hypothetical protein